MDNMTPFPLNRITRIEPIHKEFTGRVLSSASDLTADDLEHGIGIGLCLLCMLNPNNPDRESFERIIRHYCEMLAAKGYLGSGEEVWRDLFKQPTTQNKADWITTTWEVAGFGIHTFDTLIQWATQGAF